MTAEQEVAEANAGFYRAFESLKIEAMEQVWAKDADIQCGHPGWRILRGWGPVMESWKRIFENTPSMQFTLTDVKVEVRGELAWVTLYENLNSTIEGQNYSAAILTTNMFQRTSEGWRMILHHGSSVSQPPDQDVNSTVH
ncbi:MAG TPA: nuclear transport factor 2 family protein [Candidatus Binatia bacterium]